MYHAPSLNEIAQNTEKKNSEIKSEMTESIQQAKELQKELEDIYKKVLEKKNLSWEEKKKLEDLLKKQKELEEKVNNIKKENQQNNQQPSAQAIQVDTITSLKNDDFIETKLVGFLTPEQVALVKKAKADDKTNATCLGGLLDRCGRRGKRQERDQNGRQVLHEGHRGGFLQAVG